MSHIEELTDVPESEVDKKVYQYECAGAIKVEKIKPPDGNWTVRATFPD